MHHDAVEELARAARDAVKKCVESRDWTALNTVFKDEMRLSRHHSGAIKLNQHFAREDVQEQLRDLIRELFDGETELTHRTVERFLTGLSMIGKRDDKVV